MYKPLIYLLIFLLSASPTIAYYENGSVGSGGVNMTWSPINSCARESDLDSLVTSYDCTFNIELRRVSNMWENGRYVVNVNLELPHGYTQYDRSVKCSIPKPFGGCFKYKRSEKAKSVDANWRYSNRLYFNSNPQGRIVEIKVREMGSKSSEVIKVRIPNAIYPVDDFIFPIRSRFQITQLFGNTSFSDDHSGIDIVSKNREVLNISDGVVTYAGWDKYSPKCNNGGNIVRIKHDNGLYSAYFHLKDIEVMNNQRLEKGEVIGTLGNSGKYNCKEMGAHLHFEIRDGVNQESSIDPRNIFANI